MNSLITKEVVEKVSKVMNESGSSNIIRARYAKEIGAVINNSEKKIFCQMRSHVVNHKENAWIETYKLVLQWLSKENRTMTIETMEEELTSKNIEIPSGESQVLFKQLIAITRRKPDPISEKVEEFIEKLPFQKQIEEGEDISNKSEEAKDVNKKDDEQQEEENKNEIENQDEKEDAKSSSDKENENEKSYSEENKEETKTQIDEKDEDSIISDIEDDKKDISSSQENSKETKTEESNDSIISDIDDNDKKEEEEKKKKSDEGNDILSGSSYESIGDTEMKLPPDPSDDSDDNNQPIHTGFTSSDDDAFDDIHFN